MPAPPPPSRARDVNMRQLREDAMIQTAAPYGEANEMMVAAMFVEIRAVHNDGHRCATERERKMRISSYGMILSNIRYTSMQRYSIAAREANAANMSGMVREGEAQARYR